MKIDNLKITNNNLSVRMAPAQFIAKFGYDIEWVPQQKLFYVHDTERDQMFVIPAGETQNWVPKCKPALFMEALRQRMAEALPMDLSSVEQIAAAAVEAETPKGKKKAAS